MLTHFNKMLLQWETDIRILAADRQENVDIKIAYLAALRDELRFCKLPTADNLKIILNSWVGRFHHLQSVINSTSTEEHIDIKSEILRERIILLNEYLLGYG